LTEAEAKAELDHIAGEALAALEGGSPPTLRALAAGLRLAGGPLALLSGPIFSLSIDLEHFGAPTTPTRTALRCAMRRAVIADRTLVGGLSASPEPFWRAIGDALAIIAQTTPR
jgi:hypothetical protein